jgi:hypothetical protein
MELSGKELDAAVARILKLPVVYRDGQPAFEAEFDPEAHAHESDLKAYKIWTRFKPSSCWDDAGPIIERERISIIASEYRHVTMAAPLEWSASVGAYSHYIDEPLPLYPSDNGAGRGPTPLIAAMRAFVSSKQKPEDA